MTAPATNLNSHRVLITSLVPHTLLLAPHLRVLPVLSAPERIPTRRRRTGSCLLVMVIKMSQTLATMKTTVSRMNLSRLSTTLVHSGGAPLSVFFQHSYSSQKARFLLISSSVNGKKSPRLKPLRVHLLFLSRPNPDWQETARKRRTGAARFIPDLARANTGANGSIGALGTRDTINSGPQLSGTQFGNKKVKVDTSTTSTDGETNMTVEEHVKIDIVHRRDRRSKSPWCVAGWGRRLYAPDRFNSCSSSETDARMMTVMSREKVIAIEPEMRRREDSRRDCHRDLHWRDRDRDVDKNCDSPGLR
jgi:hypothetical protein